MIGLSKEQIVNRLTETSKDQILTEELKDAIADIITENNKKLQREITEIVMGDLIKRMQLRGLM